MNPEVLSLLFSFAVLVLIPFVIVFVVWTVRRRFSSSSVAVIDLFRGGTLAIAITVLITLAICIIFSWTGYFEAHFYRPSKGDNRAQAELSLNPHPVSFQSADGTSLQGWLLPSETAAIGTVIYFQGSDLNITYTSRHVAWLTRHGLHVFVFDYRGYGQSDGTPSRQGLIEDCDAAIEYIANRSGLTPGRIILYGQSMGGQLAINAATRRQDADIQLVISEATYARHSYHLSDKLGRLGPLWLVKWGGWLLTSDGFSGESAIAELTSTPVLLIHGDADVGVSPYHSDRLYLRAGGPKEIWRYKGYGHLRIFDDESNRERLVMRIRQALPKIEEDLYPSRGSESSGEREPPVTRDLKP